MMSDDDGLSRRERDDMRDLVIAGSSRLSRQPSRGRIVSAAAALVVVGGVVGASLAFAFDGRDVRPISPPSPTPVPSASPQGTIALSLGATQPDIAFSTDGGAPSIALPAATGGLYCPAFSADGTRLAAGTANGTDGGFRDAAVILASVDADGGATVTDTIPLPSDLTQPPCPTWSPDGDWLAMGAVTSLGTGYASRSDAVLIVEAATGDIRRLDIRASDLEWAPDGDELFIASSGLRTYSVATGATEEIAGTQGVRWFSFDPGGTRLVVQRLSTMPADHVWELAIINRDGSEPQVFDEAFDVIHGVGPEWSPDGSRIAYMRSCSTYEIGSSGSRPCREASEVSVASVVDGTVASADIVRIPPPRTRTGGVERVWFPYTVTWSPDGHQLLYVAWYDSDPLDTTSSSGAVIVQLSGEATVVTSGVDVWPYPGPPILVSQSWTNRKD